MKKVALLVALLLLITTSAFASSATNNDRWVEIENPKSKTNTVVYFDKETIEYDAKTNILTAWLRIDITDEIRAQYKKSDEKSKLYKELNKVEFNTKNRTANIDAQYYGYDKDGNKIFEGKSNKFETIIPDSNIEVFYNTVYGYYKKHKTNSKKSTKAEDVLKSIFNLPR